MAGRVVKTHQLPGAERQRCVRLAGVVAEFNFVHARRKALDDRPDLSPQQTFFGEIFEHGNHGEYFYFTHCSPPFIDKMALQLAHRVSCRHPPYGNQRALLRRSSTVHVAQTSNNASITLPIGLREWTSRSPGDSRSRINRAKWPGIVPTSRDTSTRPDSAQIRRTSGSRAPSGIAPAAVRKSIDGSRRRSPRPIAGFRSASAWNRRFKAA